MNIDESLALVDLVLLLPAPFEILPSLEEKAVKMFTRLFADLAGDKRHMASVAAMTFGVRISNVSTSYATAPTWLLHSQDKMRCELQFPVLIRREVLCQAFVVDSVAFPSYEPWVLSDVLNQQGLYLVTHPDVLFRYRAGYSVHRLATSPQCQHWSVPVGRYRNAMMLDHMHRDVSEDLRDLYYPRTIPQRSYTDFSSALRIPTTTPSQRGWSFDNGSISQWKLGAVDDVGEVYWFK